jgi:Rieske Fe-S protein
MCYFRGEIMHQIPRRRFVKGLFLGTAVSSILGKSWSSLYAATVSPWSSTATFEINVSDYPALQEEIGSVRLGVTGVGASQFPNNAGYYPVIINRDFSGFYVLSSECNHARCVVGTFNTADFAMRCPCHDSLYDIRGDVVQGPANQPLRPYDFTFDGIDKLTVSVPDIGFQARAFLPNPEPTSRVHLQFRANSDVIYEVRFREKLANPWQRALFSRTPEGPADQETLAGDGELNTVYLDRTTPTGFYAVSMVLSEV